MLHVVEVAEGVRTVRRSDNAGRNYSRASPFSFPLISITCSITPQPNSIGKEPAAEEETRVDDMLLGVKRVPGRLSHWGRPKQIEAGRRSVARGHVSSLAEQATETLKFRCIQSKEASCSIRCAQSKMRSLQGRGDEPLARTGTLPPLVAQGHK